MMKCLRTVMILFLFAVLVSALAGADLTVKVIQSEGDLPEKFSNLWQKGDFLVTDGRFLILIGGSSRPQWTVTNNASADALGSILGFVPAGRNLQGPMNLGAPSVRIKARTEYAVYKTVTPGAKASDGSLAVECAGTYEKKDWGKLDIRTTYTIVPGEGKILFASTIRNTGTADVKDLSYSLYMNANHSYLFSPYNRTSTPDLNFRVYPRKGHYLGWLNPNPVEEGDRRLPGTLKPGETFKVRYSLLVDTRAETLLQSLYDGQKTRTLRTSFAFKNVEGRFMEVVVRELFTGTMFFRTFLEEPFVFDIPLPPGDYAVRANFFPAVRELNLAVKQDSDNLLVMENPASGSVKVKIRNGKGEYVPGKVSFIGLDPTKTPYFQPENPRDTGRNHEAFKDSVYPPEEGLAVNLPVGRYLVAASRGPEYTREEKTIEVLKGDVLTATFTIDKVIETPNLVSLDAHLHTQNSDGQMLVPERLKSIVGEGVEVAVATDHNYVTNYAPVLKRLGLAKDLTVILGSEVTKDNTIHYCAFPMILKEEEPRKGAISVEPDGVATLFADSRAKNPPVLLQINHPRAGTLGYFNNFGLDKETAAFASAGFDPGFNLLEVVNGPGLLRGNLEAIEDWFHLLNRGYFFAITGNSDSHAIDESEPGFSRTYIHYSGPKGDALDAGALFLALKQGHSFVTNGPFIDFKVNGASIPGDTLTAKGGRIDLAVKVTSAPWIGVDEVRVIFNGERRIVFPIAAGSALEKFRLPALSLTLDRDTSVVIEVVGKRSIYPVVQRAAADGLPQNAILPFALTNPVFVDVDGNGKFDPPWPEKIKIKAATAEGKNL